MFAVLAKGIRKTNISSPYCVARKKSCLHTGVYASLQFFARALSGLEILIFRKPLVYDNEK